MSHAAQQNSHLDSEGKLNRGMSRVYLFRITPD